MTDKQALAKLLRAETALKKTKAGYTPTGPNWKTGMPLLWEVRKALGTSDDGQALAEAHGILKETKDGYDPRKPRWKKAMKLIDGVESNLAGPGVPNLGPIVVGDKALLLLAPTHNTDGLGFTGSAYPAVDTGWVAGKKCLAPESMIVTRQSSAQGADAFYADGVSGLKYWFGHIVSAPATGRRLLKGEQFGTIAKIPGADHLHCGIDARKLLGGRDLKWGRNGRGPDYTYGSPTIGQQLYAGLNL